MTLASLMLDQLEETEEGEVLSKLDEVPETVEKFYAQQTKKIYDDTKPFTRKHLKQILSWVAWASETIGPEEVAAMIDDKFWDEAKVRREIREGCLTRCVSESPFLSPRG